LIRVSGIEPERIEQLFLPKSVEPECTVKFDDYLNCTYTYNEAEEQINQNAVPVSLKNQQCPKELAVGGADCLNENKTENDTILPSFQSKCLNTLQQIIPVLNQQMVMQPEDSTKTDLAQAVETEVVLPINLQQNVAAKGPNQALKAQGTVITPSVSKAQSVNSVPSETEFLAETVFFAETKLSAEAIQNEKPQIKGMDFSSADNANALLSENKANGMPQPAVQVSNTSSTQITVSVDSTHQNDNSYNKNSSEKNNVVFSLKETEEKENIKPEFSQEAYASSASKVFSGRENSITSVLGNEKVFRQVADSVMKMIETENRELSMQLSPETLGKIHIEMKLLSGKLEIKITADNPDTSEMLNQHLEQLKIAFNNNDIKFTNVEINSSLNQVPIFTDLHQSFGNEGSDSEFNRSNNNLAETANEAENINDAAFFRKSSLYDYLV
jgi:flagellar hook-length control protein FliK